MKQSVRVLIIEALLEEARFLQDALAEAQETRATSVVFECLHLESMDDATVVLATETFHVVVLGCAPLNRAAIEAFRTVRRLAPSAAIFISIDAEDAQDRGSFLRDGAQDCLVRGRFDYLDLSRALEDAIERQKFLAAVQSVAMKDAESGLLTAYAFRAFAARQWPLMARAAVAATLVLIDTPARAVADLIHMAGALEIALSNSAMVGRLGAGYFAVLGEWPDEEAAETAVRNCVADPAVKLGIGRCDPRFCDFDALLHRAETDLCENGHAYTVPIA